jgi:hypothetical protein
VNSLYFPFTLRIYGHVLKCLRDHNFTGLDLFYRIKDCWKGRDTPGDLLIKPLERGLPYKIGEWCFDTLFKDQSESMSTLYVKALDGEDFMWFLEDLVRAAAASGLFGTGRSLARIRAAVSKIEKLYESDEAAYWKSLQGKRRRELTDLFTSFCTREHRKLDAMKSLYAPEVADRILHDRELCCFVAETVMDIGFDGETTKGIRSQWVKRATWPARVKAILNARDRGKCALCGADISMELEAEGHIDHMFPISRGGCNDIVNLQLLCSACNLKKLAKTREGVASSVPQYIRRRQDT